MWMRDALAIQQQASQRSELVIPSVDLAEDTRIAQERYTNGIQNIAIIGAGLLGSAVAADMSMCRVKVFVYDRNTASIDRLKATMERLCSPLVSQELLTREDLQTVMNNIVPCYTLEDAVSSADLVIEMVPEDLDLKRRVASDIERSGKPGVVIATSTLTLNLDAIRYQNFVQTCRKALTIIEPICVIYFTQSIFEPTRELPWNALLAPMSFD